MNGLLLRGGSLIDGTGAAPRTFDVAIREGFVRAIGRVMKPMPEV